MVRVELNAREKKANKVAVCCGVLSGRTREVEGSKPGKRARISSCSYSRTGIVVRGSVRNLTLNHRSQGGLIVRIPIISSIPGYFPSPVDCVSQGVLYCVLLCCEFIPGGRQPKTGCILLFNHTVFLFQKCMSIC